MVACLEKTKGKFEIHEIVDFLTSSTIHHALTVSSTIYTSYIEQFWNTTSSQTINDDKQIHATIDSKAIVVKEALIRSSLLFNDDDGTACLKNEAIFQNLALMGYEEGKGSRAPTEPQPTPSPTHPSIGDQPPLPHDSPILGGHTYDIAKGALNLEELFSICTNLSNTVLALETVKDAQAAEIIALKARIKKLEKKCMPSISHHGAWLKSVQRLSMKKRFRKKESVSKQGRKKDKPKPILNDSTFDGLDADHGMDYMDTEEPVNEGRLRGSTKELVSTARPEDSTVRPDVGTADPLAPPIITTRIEADALFVAKLQQEEREEYIIEETTKFLAKTIAAQRRFRNIGGYKHSQLKAKTFIEIQGLYERQKRMIDDFKPMYSDDAVDKEKVLEEPDITKVEVKQEGDEESIRKRPGRRLKMKATKKSKRQKTDSDLKEEENLKTFLQIVLDEKGEVDYKVLDKRFPIINWESKFYHLDRHGVEYIYYRIFRSDGSSRWINTFSKMVTRFDRMDLDELYNLVMQRFETTSPEGVDLVLWGDLRTMFEETTNDDLWKNQEEWILKKRKYPLTKETLERMLALRLIAESKSEAVFDLLRFIQKQIDESGSHDGSEKYLKELASPKQAALEQTTTGKETSNPFMAGSLPKTT
nr:hypothetical protein [Tanacetum cinerariifolium]